VSPERRARLHHSACRDGFAVEVWTLVVRTRTVLDRGQPGAALR
jgi:hypothetical protein